MNIFRMFYNEFIRPTPKVKVGDIVKFQGILKEMSGIVEKVGNNKAKIDCFNCGTGKTSLWIEYKKLVIINSYNGE